ncbi:MAG: hypothetical protein ACE5JU_15475, partial [Candidatus Binatia bacterium]
MELVDRKDTAISLFIFWFFVLLYSFFRFSEEVLDSSNIIYYLITREETGTPLIFSPRHYLSTVWFYAWVYLAGVLGYGRVELSSSVASLYATTLNRVVMLNSIVVAATLSITYIISRIFGAGRKESAVAVGLFGVATSTWLLATSAERQLVGIFLIGSGMLASTFLRTKHLTHFVVAGFISSLLIILSILTYLPLIMFFPVIGTLWVIGVKWEGGSEETGRRSSKIRTVCFCTIFVGTYILIKMVTGISMMSVSGHAIAQFAFYANPSSTDYWSALDHQIVLNNLFALLCYFGGWVSIPGVHEISIHERMKDITFLVSASLSAILVGTIFYWSLSNLRRYFLHARGTRWILHSIRWDRGIAEAMFAVWVIIGFVVVMVSRVGTSVEFWYLVIWGAVPLLALRGSKVLGSPYGKVMVGLPVLLLAVNAIAGMDNFKSDFRVRNEGSIAQVTEVGVVMEAVGEKDIIVGDTLNSSVYWLRLLSGGKVKFAFLDWLSTQELVTVLNETVELGGSIYVSQDMLKFKPTESDRKLFKRLHSESFFENQALIMRHYRLGDLEI